MAIIVQDYCQAQLQLGISTEIGKWFYVEQCSVLLVNLDQNIGLEKNQIIGDIGCFPGQI